MARKIVKPVRTRKLVQPKKGSGKVRIDTRFRKSPMKMPAPKVRKNVEAPPRTVKFIRVKTPFGDMFLPQSPMY